MKLRNIFALVTTIAMSVLVTGYKSSYVESGKKPRRRTNGLVYSIKTKGNASNIEDEIESDITGLDVSELDLDGLGDEFEIAEAINVQLIEGFDAVPFINKGSGTGNSFYGENSDGGILNLNQKGTEVFGSVIDTKRNMVFQIKPFRDRSITLGRNSNEFPAEADVEDQPDLDGRLLRRNTETGQSFNISDQKGRDLEERKIIIDVMVLWTQMAECKNAGENSYCEQDARTENSMRGLIDLAIEETNTAYSKSGIMVELFLVYANRTDYSEQPYPSSTGNSFSRALYGLRKDGDGIMDDVHTIRDNVGADVVALLIGDGKYCGLGFIGPREDLAFSVTNFDCATGYFSFGHEIGHNLGCNHDRGAKDRCRADSDFNYAYRHPGAKFRSIMAYNCRRDQCDNNAGGGCGRVQRFSNTEFKYGGSNIGNSQNDNARQIRNVAEDVASYRSRPVTPLSSVEIYQASRITDSEGCVERTSHSGFTGTNYVDMGGLNSYVEWNFIDGGTKGGACILDVRYSVGTGNGRPCEVYVNGIKADQSFNFPNTGSWDTWKTERIAVSCRTLRNTIRLKASSNFGGPNLDWLGVSIDTTLVLTATPSLAPTAPPTRLPTKGPTREPTKAPSQRPTQIPTKLPTQVPTKLPTDTPTEQPTEEPTITTTLQPTKSPTLFPTTFTPTDEPTQAPTKPKTLHPTSQSTPTPTISLTLTPTTSPTESHSHAPSSSPTLEPTKSPSSVPTKMPSLSPTTSPTKEPSLHPTASPTESHSQAPSSSPTLEPTKSPSSVPTKMPTLSPTHSPTMEQPLECSGELVPVKFILITDNFPEDISWNITRQDSDIVVMEYSGYLQEETEKEFKYEQCVEDVSYVFELVDAWKDGLCCKYLDQGMGSTSLYYNGDPVFQNISSFTHGIGPLQFGPPLSTSPPTLSPVLTSVPTLTPTKLQTRVPTNFPTRSPTLTPTTSPTESHSHAPSSSPTLEPTKSPSSAPTQTPTLTPTYLPSKKPTPNPTASPTESHSQAPSSSPTLEPTKSPSSVPTKMPSLSPTTSPTKEPSLHPTASPTESHSQAPSSSPTLEPTKSPSSVPTKMPTLSPTHSPTKEQPLECSGELVPVKFILITDNFPEDISWNITRQDSDIVVMEYSGYLQEETEKEFKYEQCVEDVSYEFELVDAWKDGLCCKYLDQGMGSTSLYYNGDPVFQNISSFTHGIGPLQFGPPLSTSPPTLSPVLTSVPTLTPTKLQTRVPTNFPTRSPTLTPTTSPTESHSHAPSSSPTLEPTKSPSSVPTKMPSLSPTTSPTKEPSLHPTASPTESHSQAPSSSPTLEPTKSPSSVPTKMPTLSPTHSPTKEQPLECSGELVPVKFILITDNFPEDISWNITRQDSDIVVMEYSGYLQEETEKEFKYEQCVEDVSYEFELVDAWKDGLCCKYLDQGMGSTSLYYNGDPVFQNISSFTHGIGPLQFGPPLSTSPPTLSPVLTSVPTLTPTKLQTRVPTNFPTRSPTLTPTTSPTESHSHAPSSSPTLEPTKSPSSVPTKMPSLSPTTSPTKEPSLHPTASPTESHSQAPSSSPTLGPTKSPSSVPTKMPTLSPTHSPTKEQPLECSGELVPVKFILITDNFPEDISWNITRQDSDIVVMEYSGYLQEETEKEFKYEQCVEDVSYEFELVDAWKDGLCCKYLDQGMGSTSLYYNGDPVFQNISSFTHGIGPLQFGPLP